MLRPQLGPVVALEQDAAHDAQEMRQRQHLPIACAHSGMPRNGNMKPDSSIDGRKKKNVICIACSWLLRERREREADGEVGAR